MLDSHCHIDLYAKPSEVADRAERAGVFTIVVTNLPSAWERNRPYIAERRLMRLALGLHPLLADQHGPELEKFRTLLTRTSFIGEVGLDFSREGKPTADLQIESFRFVLNALDSAPKFLTVHSRRAEAHVLKMLKVARRSPVVFHWYSGSIKDLKSALEDGHFFSINPHMVSSDNGRKIIAAIPRDRILTETDGPFVTVDGRIVEPIDVVIVEKALAELWKVSPLDARQLIAANFRRIVEPLKLNNP